MFYNTCKYVIYYYFKTFYRLNNYFQTYTDENKHNIILSAYYVFMLII